MNVTVELTGLEAAYAIAALRTAADNARALHSGDDWLDRTAVGLFESAKAKIEAAAYPRPFERADLADEIELGLA